MAHKVIRVAPLAKEIGVCQSTIWRWVAEGRFPKPYKIGERVTVWDVAAIEEYFAQQRGGK